MPKRKRAATLAEKERDRQMVECRRLLDEYAAKNDRLANRLRTEDNGPAELYIDSLRREIERLTTENRDLKSGRDFLKDQLAEAIAIAQKVAALSYENQELKRRNGALSDELKALKITAARRQRMINGYQAQIAELRNEIAALLSQVKCRS